MRGSMMTAFGIGVVVLAVGTLIAADAEDAKKDLEKLQGTWALVAGERDGKKFTEEEGQEDYALHQGRHVPHPREQRGN